MSGLKRLEHVGKGLLAWVAAALLWRPERQQRALRLLENARRVLLVRIDDRVGEALLMTPLLSALRDKGLEVDVLVHAKVARVLAGHPAASEVIAFDRRRLVLGAWAPGVRSIRARRYDVIVNCGNWQESSVTSALVSRLVAFRSAVVGPAVLPAGSLADVAVPALADTENEVAQRQHLLQPLGVEGARASLSFRVPNLSPAFRERVREVEAAPHAVVNPGGRLGWRRIPAEAFAAAARALLSAGRKALVTWGPGEEALAREVVALAPGAVLAPPTNLDELAALMSAARLTVCNNTGPMHLSVAVGAPTLALFLHMRPERWGHGTFPHRILDLTPVAQAGGDLPAAVGAAASTFAAENAASR